MALIHEFYILTHEFTKEAGQKDIDREILEFAVKNRKSAVWVHDNVILPHLDAFKEIETVVPQVITPHMLPVRLKGLDYYGFTIFLPDSLPRLCEIFRSIAIGIEFNEVIGLCKKAYDSRLAVLHWGI